MPNLGRYDGTGDPHQHLRNFQGVMSIQGADETLLCKTLPTTFLGIAQDWYNDLPSRSIGSFHQLCLLFCEQFAAGRKQRKAADHLLTLEQEEGEPLRAYLERFNTERMGVRCYSEELAIAAFKRGLRNRDLIKALHLDPPTNVGDMIHIARAHIITEEALAHQDKWIARAELPQEKDIGNTRGGWPSKREQRRQRYQKIDQEVAKLKVPRHVVMMVAQAEGHLQSGPPKMRGRRNPNKFCQYHKDHGHDTEDCYQLKKDIDKLIKKGFYRAYVDKDEKQKINPPDSDQENAVIFSEGSPLIALIQGQPTMNHQF